MSSYFKKLLIFSLLAWVAMGVHSRAVRAAATTIDVETTDDEVDNNDNKISLREAVNLANFFGGDFIINLQAGATYKLTITGPPDDTDAAGDLDISGVTSLIINGNGSTIDATAINERIFQVPSVNLSLTLNDLILTGGNGTTGGAISFQGNSGGTLNINRCWIHDNNDNGFGGGGIAANSVNVNITDTTISHNKELLPGANGGGLIVANSSLILTNTTISGNEANNNGGGIFFSGPVLAASFNSTVTANKAGAKGGGIFQTGGTAFALRNSVFAGNGAGTGSPDCSKDASQTVNSQGFNVLGAVDDCVIAAGAGDQDNVLDAMLGPLQPNGGTTIIKLPTHRPLPGSPVIDKGDPNGCQGNNAVLLTNDERGLPRPVDGDNNGTVICDIGAVELEQCGNGKIEGAETCESGQCCDSSTCQFKSSGTTCDDGIASTTNDQCNASGACSGTPPGGGGGKGGSGGGCRLETADVAGGSAVMFLLSLAVAGLVVVRRSRF